MDRKISSEVIQRRKIKLYIRIAAITLIVGAVFGLFIILMTPSVKLSDIATSVVTRDSLEITVSAVGKVQPFYEEIITSPVSSKILETYKKAGEVVEKDEIILKLDLDAINTDLEKLREELEMKQSKLELLRATSQSTLLDLKMQIEIEEMKLKRTEVLLKNEIYLDSIGGGTEDRIRQVELEYDVDKLKLKQLKLKYENQTLTTKADIKISELDYSIALKNYLLKQKTQAEALVKSPGNSTLIWVNNQIGTAVNQGSQLAIIADLDNFMVMGEISENYRSRINPGNRAIVNVNNKKLTGIISNVVPSVNDGIINFTVLLDEPDNEILRSGLKVDIHIVNSILNDILCIDNRSYYVGEGEYDLWVISKNEAKKKKVMLGEANYEKVEVKSGLEEGEMVIVSDMNNYRNDSQISIK